MNGRKQVAIAFLGSEVLSAILARSSLALALVALSLVALLAGYVRRSARLTVFAGLSIYYPLSDAVARAFSGPWSFLASGVLLIVLCEKLSFEYQLSSVLDSPRGLDEESKLLALNLSKSHTAALSWFALLAFAVSSLSFFVSKFPPFAPLIAAASILLMLTVWLYARR